MNVEYVDCHGNKTSPKGSRPKDHPQMTTGVDGTSAIGPPWCMLWLSPALITLHVSNNRFAKETSLLMCTYFMHTGSCFYKSVLDDPNLT